MTEFVKSIAMGFWNIVLEMSPYLLFGFFMAGLLSVLVSKQLVEKHLGGRGFWPVVKASLFGVPLPLCSCSVIPVTMSLRKHGASRGAAVSFLLSTPQTGVDSIFVTYALLGPVFAIFRPIAAFVTGIVGGVMVNLFGDSLENGSQQNLNCEDECCSGGHKSNPVTRMFKYGFITLPRDIGRAMLLGLVVAAFISALIPDGFFADKLGTGIFPMLVMMLIGIPMYVCATASVPIAAALMLKGLSPGAALVFLMTGPATNAASIVIIWKIMGRATAITYLAAVAGCALLSGIILDYIITGVAFAHTAHHGWMMPCLVQYVSAIMLFIVLTFAILYKPEDKGLTH
jgi:uncharacterized membrane protein YraQ (UPF0718 family)